MKEKKPNIFTRIRDWWKNDLDDDTRDWLKIVGIWTVDGAMFGSIITAGIKNRQIRKAVRGAEAKGYLKGTIETYQEVLQNQPIQQMPPYVTRMPANYIKPQNQNQNQFKKH